MLPTLVSDFLDPLAKTPYIYYLSFDNLHYKLVANFEWNVEKNFITNLKFWEKLAKKVENNWNKISTPENNVAKNSTSSNNSTSSSNWPETFVYTDNEQLWNERGFYSSTSSSWKKWSKPHNGWNLALTKDVKYPAPVWNWVNYELENWRTLEYYPAYNFCVQKWSKWRLPTWESLVL